MRPAVRALTLSIVLLLATSASAAATPYADISSAGPLTHVYLGNELSCQADRSGAKQLYPTANTPGDCGTFAAYGGTLYKPDFAGHGGSTATGMGATGTVFTPVSQSAVTGAGTIASPYRVVTVVTAGPKLRMTQTETYVTGDEHWSTRLDVENLDSAALTTSIYRAMDCFLGGADTGYGYRDVSSGGVGCSAATDNSPPGVVQALIPAAGQGAIGYEATYSNVWLKVRTQATLDGTCICSTLDDNGVALQWQLSLAVGETKNLTFATLFSPTGVIPPPPAAAPANVTAPDAGSGAVTQGTAITATAGTWTDASSQSQRWQRCTSTSAGSCTDISGATGLTYTPVADDVGNYLRIVETATNTTGTTEQASAIGSQVVAGTPPAVVPPPAVVTPPAAPGGDGELVEGGELRADDGAFADAVGARQYQFQRCASSDPASCADIPGATGSSYRSTADDVGYRLRLLVTASNAGGSTTAASSMTSVVRGSSAGEAPPAQATTPCVSNRVMRLHWSVPSGAHMRGFTISINGRLVANLSRRARTVRISLRGRSPQTVRVAIRGRSRAGGVLGSTRTYRTCTKVRSGTLKNLRLTRLRS